MRASNRSLRPVLGLSLTVLAGCNTTGFDLDFRNPGGPGTSEAVRTQTAPRPRADDRGIISYPNYQVVVARGGDTVSAISRRLGLNAETLARHNGISPDVPLRAGEILVLPRRVAEPSPATGAPSTGPLRPNEEVDITTLAGEAIQRAESTSPKPSPTP
ncbi:LysM peptidoglycan-binding domain-containing protein, partial [Rhodovulum imhoffii]